MQEYAFEAWQNAENNGRKNLVRTGELDKGGSRQDFCLWLSGKEF